MPSKTFRGDSVPIAQVTRIKQPTTSGPVTLSINDKALVFSSWDIDLIVATWNGTTDTVNPVSQTEEFTDITASKSGSDLILTAKNPGKPFIVVALLAGDAVTNEVQLITIGHAPTGGTFTLTFGANTTSALAYNASAATIQTALEGLASIGVGNVLVTGNAGGPWTVKFIGSLAGVNTALITANGANLTGGDSTIVVETIVNGSVAVNEVQSFKLNGSPTGGTFTLSFGGQTTSNIAYNANAAAVQSALVALTSIGAGNVSCGGGALPSTAVTVTFQGALAGVDVPLLTGDTTNITGSTLAGTISTPTPGVLGTDLIKEAFIGSRAAYLSPAPGGYDYYRWRFFNGTTTENGAIDIEDVSSAADVRASLEALPSIGVGNVAVTKLLDYAGHFTLQFQGALHATNPIVSLIRGGFLFLIRDPLNAHGNFNTIALGIVQVDSAGTNETQRITIAGTPTVGTFTLTFNGQTTAPIQYNASAANVVTALTALSNIGAGGVTGSGGALPGTAVDITFASNGLQATDVAAMTIDITGLKAPVQTTTQGVPGVNERQRLTINGSPFSGTFTITIGAATTAALAYNVSNASLDTALEGLAGIGAGKVTITGGPLPGTAVIVAFDSTLGNVGQMTTVNSLNNGTVSIAEIVPGGVVVTLTEDTRSSGPNHWDDPVNWYPVGIPDSGDTVNLQSGDSDLLYGIKQRSTFTVDPTSDVLTLATARMTFVNGQKVRVSNAGGGLPGGLTAGTDYFVINAGVGGDAKLQLSTAKGGSAVNVTTAGTGTQTIEVLLAELRDQLRYTGKIGLPQFTENGNREYRPTYLEIGATLLNVGLGQGTGSGRFKIDTGASQTAVKVYDTGGAVDNEGPAFVWKGANAANTLQVLLGDVGVALLAGEVALLASLIQRGGNIELGDGATITGPIDKTGGILVSQDADLTGVLSLRG